MTVDAGGAPARRREYFDDDHAGAVQQVGGTQTACDVRRWRDVWDLPAAVELLQLAYQ